MQYSAIQCITAQNSVWESGLEREEERELERESKPERAKEREQETGNKRHAPRRRLTQTHIDTKNGWCESNWLVDLVVTGEYVLMVETAGQHFKGTAFVQLFNDDHRCTTIVPPMREEILVTFGQVISRTVA